MRLVVRCPRPGAIAPKVRNLPISLCISLITQRRKAQEETTMEVAATVMLTSIVLYMIQQVRDLT